MPSPKNDGRSRAEVLRIVKAATRSMGEKPTHQITFSSISNGIKLGVERLPRAGVDVHIRQTIGPQPFREEFTDAEKLGAPETLLVASQRNRPGKNQ